MSLTLPQEIYQILTPEGEVVAELPDLADEQYLKIYRWMLLGRIFSDRLVALQRQGRLGTLAAINGQEATSVGLAAPLQGDDWLTGSYREVLSYMVKGVPMTSLLAYYAGRLDHQAPPEARCLQIQIVLATQMLHAVGLGMAIKYDGKPNVAVGVCGDGATSEGDFNEALNFAGVFQAPVVLVVQNNGWAISVPRQTQTAAAYIAHRGPGFGVPSYIVDGNDVLAVYKLMQECVTRAREGGGPTLIEAITYRLGAHTTADDPTKYRPDSELEQWKPRDPLIRFRKFLLNRDLLSETDDQQMEAAIRDEVQTAVSEFESWPPQEPLELFDLVYEQPTPPLQAQKLAMQQEMER